MFDKLDDLLIRFEEVLNELGEPGVTDNQEHFQKLMKEQSDLQPIVDAYREYKKNKETIQDSLSMLEEEKDEDMREMLKEELSEAKKNVEELEHELKILLLPKDPNDNKNVTEQRGSFQHLPVPDGIRLHVPESPVYGSHLFHSSQYVGPVQSSVLPVPF